MNVLLEIWKAHPVGIDLVLPFLVRQAAPIMASGPAGLATCTILIPRDHSVIEEGLPRCLQNHHTAFRGNLETLRYRTILAGQKLLQTAMPAETGLVPVRICTSEFFNGLDSEVQYVDLRGSVDRPFTHPY